MKTSEEQFPGIKKEFINKDGHYVITVSSYDVDSEGNMQDGTFNQDEIIYHGTSLEGIYERLTEVRNKIGNVAYGVKVEIDVKYAELDEDYEEGDNIIDYLELVDSVFEYWFTIGHKYRSLEGAILCFWSWQKHVGYARKFKEITIGRSGQDETICISKDETFVPQCSVLAYPEELSGDDEKDKEICLSALRDMGKWQNQSEIISQLDLTFPNAD